MTSRPTAKAIEVRAIGVPSVPMAATAPARAKFTPAPMKRPTEVQKANAVARASVPNSSGSHRLKIAKLPPNIAAEHAKEEQYRHECRQRRAGRQIECPAEGQGDRDHHAQIVERECRAPAEPLGEPGRCDAAQYGA